MADVAEHDAEQKRVSDGHKAGGVQISIAGQAVHGDEHFKWPGEPVVFQLDGRLAVRSAVHGIGFVVLAGFHAVHHQQPLLQAFYIAFRHIPADIIRVLQRDDILAHVEDLHLIVEPGGVFAQALDVCGRGDVAHVVQLFLLGLQFAFLRHDLRQRVLRRAVHKIRHPHALEVQVGEDIVHFFGVAFGHEVHTPVILAVKVVLTEGERVVVVIRQLQVAVLGDAPEAHLQVFAGEDLVHACMQACQMVQLRFCLGIGGQLCADLSLALAALSYLGGKRLHLVLHRAVFEEPAAVFLQSGISAHVLDEPERAGQQRRVQVFRRARRCVDALGVLVGVETRQLGKHFKRLLGVLLRPVDVNVLHFYHAHAVVPRFFSIAPAPRRGEGDGRGVRLPRYGQYFKKALICSGERP